MPVPTHLAVLRRLVVVPLVLSTAMAFSYARGPQPDLRIPLDPLGFQKLTQEFLLNGSSMLTLDFLDSRHLLVTFEVRTLLKRIPGDPPDDQDRNIRALLLELPSGRILAHTDWRTHDRGQYLWNLGQGHFLLRIRDTVTAFAPLRNLATGDPFQQRPFLTAVGRRIGALMLTPEANVLTVETKALPPAKPAADPGPGQSSDPISDRDPVQINFYRIDSSGDAIHALYAGAGRARAYGSFPLTDAGYLDILDQGHHRWAFNFDTFTGKVWELSPFDSTCRPSPVFVSRSEFVAFGCRNTPNPQVLGGFNMRGEEMWQQGLFGDYIAPSFTFSPASGRFAFSRILSTTPLDGATPIIPETISAQSVTVYQSDSGRQILKAECSPVEPAGGNFALSPDGLNLAIVHDGAIEIYKLPELTSKEQKTLKLAQSSSPQPVELPVHLTGASPAPSASVEATAQPAAAQPSTSAAPSAQPDPAAATRATGTAAAPPASQPQSSATQPATTQSTSASGDQQSTEPRKPPTLYTLPTDPPHNPSRSK